MKSSSNPLKGKSLKDLAMREAGLSHKDVEKAEALTKDARDAYVFKLDASPNPLKGLPVRTATEVFERDNPGFNADRWRARPGVRNHDDIMRLFFGDLSTEKLFESLNATWWRRFNAANELPLDNREFKPIGDRKRLVPE